MEDALSSPTWEDRDEGSDDESNIEDTSTSALEVKVPRVLSGVDAVSVRPGMEIGRARSLSPSRLMMADQLNRVSKTVRPPPVTRVWVCLVSRRSSPLV